MIKFTANLEDGKTLVGFGLSEKNVETLKTGRPIQVDLTDLGVYVGYGISILIFYGKTEEAMKTDLQHYINEDTLVFENGKEGKPN